MSMASTTIDVGEILDRLRVVREAKMLSQDDLARRLGIDRTTYVRKENGRIPVTTEEWLKISRIIEEDVEFFFSGSGGGSKNGNGNGKGRIKGEVDASRNIEDEKETLLLRLYRNLTSSEKGDFLFALFLVLKRVRRRKVQETLKLLVR